MEQLKEWYHKAKSPTMKSYYRNRLIMRFNFDIESEEPANITNSKF